MVPLWHTQEAGVELHLKTVGPPFRAMTTHFSSRALEDRRLHPRDFVSD